MQKNFIGDVHGYASELKDLLALLGYRKSATGHWKVGTGSLIFLGDLIDRGPQQKQTVEIVRELCELGYAKCLMGNHEFNAVGFVTKRTDKNGIYVRNHTEKHIKQHEGFLKAYAHDVCGYHEALEWFANLPLWHQAENFRAIHACWHAPAQNVLKSLLTASNEPQDRSFFERTGIFGSPLCEARELLLNGLEARLPQEASFQDYYGVRRQRIRVNWWDTGQDTFRKAAVISESQRNVMPDLPLPTPAPSYDGPLCFFGHYWMRGKPCIQHPQAVCLDYSVALDDGALCAYRFQGETVAKKDNLVWVSRKR